MGKVLARSKVGKHFVCEILEESFSYRRDEKKIAKEADLDGIYVVRSSVPKEALDGEQTVDSYKSLSKVERAFRSLKTVDLKIRPIHHRLAGAGISVAGLRGECRPRVAGLSADASGRR